MDPVNLVQDLDLFKILDPVNLYLILDPINLVQDLLCFSVRKYFISLMVDTMFTSPQVWNLTTYHDCSFSIIASLIATATLIKLFLNT